MVRAEDAQVVGRSDLSYCMRVGRYPAKRYVGQLAIETSRRVGGPSELFQTNEISRFLNFSAIPTEIIYKIVKCTVPMTTRYT